MSTERDIKWFSNKMDRKIEELKTQLAGWEDDSIERIVRLRESGLALWKIGEKVGLSRNTIKNRLKEAHSGK